MREIKFRAWQGIEQKKGLQFVKRMWSWEEISHQWSLSDFCNPEKQGRVLMQFTGLKDKYGKEIYEGDVVTWLDRTGVVGFWQGEFIVKWNKEASSLNERLRLHSESVVVIGNIHENPELLK